MARQKKDGLHYFSFDTDFFYADKRIKRLHSRYGNNGLILYIYLLTEIYRNGYYARWDEDLIDDAMGLNLKEGFIEQVMKFFVDRGLIVKKEIKASNNPDTIITSPGIQRRYQEAVKSLKRDVYVNGEIWLLDKSETAACIKVTQNEEISKKKENKSGKNSNKSVKNDTKEIKGNETNNLYDDGDVRARVKEITASYVDKYWGRKATDADCEIAWGLLSIVKNHAVCFSNDKAELLKYAFECSVSANVINWNYIHGVIQRLRERGIRNLDQAYEFDFERDRNVSG